MTSDTTIQHVARMWAGDQGNRPVVITEGDQPPTAVGEPGTYWTESGKTQVHYPRAYQEAGGYAVYHPSTRVTEVGSKLVERFQGVRKVELDESALNHRYGYTHRCGTAYEIIGTEDRDDDGTMTCRALHSSLGHITTQRQLDRTTQIVDTGEAR